MSWLDSKEHVQRYADAAFDIREYCSLFREIRTNENCKIKKRAYEILEYRIEIVTGHYRFKNYNAFRSSAYYYKQVI